MKRIAYLFAAAAVATAFCSCGTTAWEIAPAPDPEAPVSTVYLVAR